MVLNFCNELNKYIFILRPKYCQTGFYVWLVENTKHCMYINSSDTIICNFLCWYPSSKWLIVLSKQPSFSFKLKTIESCDEDVYCFSSSPETTNLGPVKQYDIYKSAYWWGSLKAWPWRRRRWRRWRRRDGHVGWRCGSRTLLRASSPNVLTINSARATWRRPGQGTYLHTLRRLG